MPERVRSADGCRQTSRTRVCGRARLHSQAPTRLHPRAPGAALAVVLERAAVRGAAALAAVHVGARRRAVRLVDHQARAPRRLVAAIELGVADVVARATTRP